MVSVIVPVYNVENYLEQCIESIRKQTYTNIEIILIDDGSTDMSGHICDSYAKVDERIKVIHQINSGVANARNMGIRNAMGEYIVFVDSDDWIDPDMLECFISNMNGVDMISTAYWKNHENNQTFMRNTIPVRTYDDEESICYFKKHMMYSGGNNFDDALASTCNKMFRSDYLKKIFETINISISYEEDAILVYTYVMQCNSIKILDKPFYHYRMRMNSATHSFYPQFLKNVSDIYEYLYELFSKDKLSSQLILQLQKWIAELVIYGINEKMNFMECAKILTYRVPFLEYISEKKIILYGAGKIGKEYARSLKKRKYYSCVMG